MPNGVIPTDMLFRSQLTGRKRAHTAYQDEGAYKCSGENDNKKAKTGFDGCSIMRENKPKTKQFLSGRWRGTSVRTVKQVNLHLFGDGSNAHVGFCATRRAHAVIQP